MADPQFLRDLADAIEANLGTPDGTTLGPTDAEACAMALREMAARLPAATLDKWAARFLGLAQEVASWSKDPRTKVGAVATNTARAVIETGFNGLPRGVEDRDERLSPTPLPGHGTGAKYLFTAHAEENLVAHAARVKLEGSTVHVTHFCCAACARMLINAGVQRIVVGNGKTNMPAEQFEVARTMLCEAGVEVVEATRLAVVGAVYA